MVERRSRTNKEEEAYLSTHGIPLLGGVNIVVVQNHVTRAFLPLGRSRCINERIAPLRKIDLDTVFTEQLV